MTETDNKSPGRNRRWMRILLVLSLAANLLVVGLVAGAVYRFGGPDGVRRPPPALGAALYRELSREDRRAFRRDMRQLMPALATAQAGGKGKNNENHHPVGHGIEGAQLAAALRAVPFQPDAATSVLEAHARSRRDWQAAANAAWLRRVSAMSDAERASYAARIEEALSRPARTDRRTHWRRSDN
ncbi:hypothetical protein ACFMPD_03810 [Sedimentitalea sp. HM32M-2]|uniref:hypothetical protein n=1 Tax=Sedimentitalea sp. HM32M-2 TaxID=3351566 RepID=UPI00363EE7D5